VAAKKPVLAMKAGRTMEGAKAAASHTGGLAKEDLATDLIFKKPASSISGMKAS
jgi:acyl-CoA synthetase (NDP forming)